VQAVDGQKLADVAHEPTRTARRHQRREHVPESQLAPETEPVLDRLFSRTMPIGHQIRRDQRARARPDDHPHLILELAQQHRQRPGRVRPTRPTATQHQTRTGPSITLPAHDPKPTRITATRATRPRLNRIAAPAARRGHQPARSSSSHMARPVIGPPRSAPPGAPVADGAHHRVCFWIREAELHRSGSGSRTEAGGGRTQLTAAGRASSQR
jgi:hypothetical protein